MRRNQERVQFLLGFFEVLLFLEFSFSNLQKGSPEQELHAFPRGGPIVDRSPNTNDFAEQNLMPV